MTLARSDSGPLSKNLRTTVLVGNNLGSVVDSAGNRTVGVAKGNTDNDSVAGLDASAGVCLSHCRGRKSRDEGRRIETAKQNSESIR